MTNLTTLTLTTAQVARLAIIAEDSASEAYADERLHTAASDRHLAAALWNAAGYHKAALRAAALAEAIDNELIEIAAGNTEETV